MLRQFIAAALLAAAAASISASPGAEYEREGQLGKAPVSGAAREIPAFPEFPSLVGVERKLAVNVSRYYSPDGKRWIRFYSAYDSVYRASIEDIVATLWDFEASPEVFSRIEETRVRSRSEDGTMAVTEQRTGIHVLGFTYTSNLAFRNELRRDGQETIVSFEAIEVDKSTLSSRGFWTLVESCDETGPLTYVRYFLDSYVEAKYPAQEWIMRQFGESDMRRIIRDLYKATAKRAKAR
jgi:hypothetical protein